MNIHSFQQTQLLHMSREEAWLFFSNPQNLPILTPDWMHLRMVGDLAETIYEGMLIKQKIKPLLGIPLTWETEITEIEEYVYFIDEQRVGPYKLWQHEHRLHETSNGIKLIDRLHYALPCGLLGELVHQLTVKRKITEVFAYRYKTLEQLFGKKR